MRQDPQERCRCSSPRGRFFRVRRRSHRKHRDLFKSDVIKSSHIILLSESEHEAHCFGGCVDAEHEICVALCARLDSIRAVRCESRIADRRGVRTRIGHGDNTRELNARISAVYIHADAAEFCVRACRRNGIVCADRDGRAALSPLAALSVRTFSQKPLVETDIIILL